jgi:hypothetical protein
LQEKTALKRIGEVAYNRNSEKMTIVEYNDCDNVVVQFENGFRTSVQYGNFKRGKVGGSLKSRKIPLHIRSVMSWWNNKRKINKGSENYNYS